jgi:hypothetical protein
MTRVIPGIVAGVGEDFSFGGYGSYLTPAPVLVETREPISWVLVLQAMTV